MGKYQDINHGCSKRISEMAALKKTKAEMVQECKDKYIEKNGSDKGWKDRMAMKNDCLRSVKSIQTMRAAQKPFVEFMRSNGITKFEKITRLDVEKYLVDRAIKPDGSERSSWTLSRDLMFCNKVILQSEHLKHEKQLTKRELALPSRKNSAITKGRTETKVLGIPDDRPGLADTYKDELTILRGTGCRRESIPELTVNRFRVDASGFPTEVFLKEKNGKERWAPIRSGYAESIKEIIDRHRDTPDKPFFSKYDKNVIHQQLRRDYAKAMLDYFQDRYERGEPPLYPYKITDKERQMYPHGFMGYSCEAAGQLSHILGHNRLDVLSNYIFEGRGK